MRLGRLEIGRMIGVSEPLKWFHADFRKTHCDCLSWELGPFYLNWLSDQCIPDITYGDEDILTEEDLKDDGIGTTEEGTRTGDEST